MSESNYEKLFGTPEKTAWTIAEACEEYDGGTCGNCLAQEAHCGLGDYNALLEWLRGDAE